MRVCIDAGHGGHDAGAVGEEPRRLAEKTVNLAVALRLAAAVESHGWEALQTRLVDRTLALHSRAAFANRYQADLFVSVHCNAAATPAPEGIEVYHFPGSVRGRSIALHVFDRLLLRFPDHHARGVKEANFAVLRLTRMPAILVECEFLTNPRQLELLAAPENQEALAAAIADGLVAAVDTSFQHTLPRIVLG